VSGDRESAPGADGTHLREAADADLPAIGAIFNHWIEHSTASFRTSPDTEEQTRRWFEGRGPEHPVIVADHEGRVLGWASLSPHKPTGGYRHTVELSVYLREESRGRGLGRLLLGELLVRAKAAGHHAVLAGVCTEQADSIRLHEAMGFTKVAHLREVGFKFGRWLDVAYFQKVLD
jgi:phosphinothricin acetyltransferase